MVSGVFELRPLRPRSSSLTTSANRVLPFALISGGTAAPTGSILVNESCPPPNTPTLDSLSDAEPLFRLDVGRDARPPERGESGAEAPPALPSERHALGTNSEPRRACASASNRSCSRFLRNVKAIIRHVIFCNFGAGAHTKKREKKKRKDNRNVNKCSKGAGYKNSRRGNCL